MEEADMTPGRPQQLPYVSPPDKKMSQEKSGSNIVVEWMSAIKEIAENGYVLPSTNVHSKDEKFQRIIGMCNAVIMVLGGLGYGICKSSSMDFNCISSNCRH